MLEDLGWTLVFIVLAYGILNHYLLGSTQPMSSLDSEQQTLPSPGLDEDGVYPHE